MILDKFGLVLPCRICGGKPYKYDTREYTRLCSIECDICDLMDIAPTPTAVSVMWNERIYPQTIVIPMRK